MYSFECIFAHRRFRPKHVCNLTSLKKLTLNRNLPIYTCIKKCSDTKKSGFISPKSYIHVGVKEKVELVSVLMNLDTILNSLSFSNI